MYSLNTPKLLKSTLHKVNELHTLQINFTLYTLNTLKLITSLSEKIHESYTLQINFTMYTLNTLKLITRFDVPYTYSIKFKCILYRHLM